MSAAVAPLSVVIPTYRREQVLVDTLEGLVALDPPAAEILVVDQTPSHEAAVEARLRHMHEAGAIRWLRLPQPSIPQAMNTGLQAATQELVLFLDDDIAVERELLGGHLAAHREHPGGLVAGRVIQPWEEGGDFEAGPRFRFCGLQPAWISEFMGGNFSIARADALALGGFDENFVRVAYRFEADFAQRLLAAGRRIRFEPSACLHHLKAEGGTRSFGDFLTTWRPNHSVGEHYYLLKTRGIAGLPAMLSRLFKSVATRHHLRRPWWVPFTFVSEVLGMAWACRLVFRGPKYVRNGMGP